MKNLLTCLLCALCFLSCKKTVNQNSSNMSRDSQSDSFQIPSWAKNAVIYEVNIRQYTPEGTINAFSDHIPRLKEMGVDILWIMPVFPISTTKKKGELGSYYAVSDFIEINPAFGTKQDFLNLIEKIHAYKMKVILDWVPNHTGWDHKWIKSNPEFYVKDSMGNITDPIDDKGVSHGWTDVADLNYNNPEMRAAMIKDLVYWVKNHKIDGYRMDIAFGVPLDFWKTFSDTILKVNPDLFLLAEAEDPAHLNEDAFHSCYGWDFHHLINDVAQKKRPVQDIHNWLSLHKTQFSKGNMMHFTTNHDENSWNGTEFERMGEGAQAFAVLTYVFDGIPLIYSGQEEPLRRRLEFFKKDDIGFSKFEYAGFYTKLNQTKHENEAIWNAPYGGEVIKIGKSDHVYAFEREKNGNRVVAIINLSDQPRKVTFTKDVMGVRDVFTTQLLKYKNGDDLRLEPWEYKLAVTEK